MMMDDFFEMLVEAGAYEEEDIFDGNLPGDIPDSVMDSFNESIGREKGMLWEETV